MPNPFNIPANEWVQENSGVNMWPPCMIINISDYLTEKNEWPLCTCLRNNYKEGIAPTFTVFIKICLSIMHLMQLMYSCNKTVYLCYLRFTVTQLPTHNWWNHSMSILLVWLSSLQNLRQQGGKFNHGTRQPKVLLCHWVYWCTFYGTWLCSNYLHHVCVHNYSRCVCVADQHSAQPSPVAGAMRRWLVQIGREASTWSKHRWSAGGYSRRLAVRTPGAVVWWVTAAGSSWKQLVHHMGRGRRL